MTEKHRYWLVNAEGENALVEGAAERDRFLPLGWTETTEPVADEWVMARMDGIEQPARFPATAFREVWEPRGWKPAPPAEPVSPFNGDQPAAQTQAPAVPPLSAPSPTPKPTTAAAGGDTKEK